jgi:hypothetical protein
MWPLVVTSALFMIPAFRKRKKNKILAVADFTTSIVSMNYWRNPVPGFRRSLDFAVAKSNFVIHHIVARPNNIPLDLLIVPCWYMSKQKGKNWVTWHAMFHVAVTAGMCFVQ